LLRQTDTKRFGVSYSSFKTYGWSLYTNVSIQRNDNQITNAVVFDGINGSSTPIQIETSTHGVNTMFRLNYNKRFWKFSTTNRFFYTENINIFETIQTKNFSRNLNSTLEFRTNVENLPNIDISLQNSYLNNKNSLFANSTRLTTLDLAGEYDYRNWKFRTSYLQNYYRNNSQSNAVNFDQINGSIFYHKEDSLWEFGVDFHNLGNNRTRTSNNYNQIRFSETNTLVFPRTVMFNVFYKL
jgi:hypothetical protein